MPDLRFFVAIAVLSVVVLVVTCLIYALLSRSLWYAMNALTHELEVVRAQVTREVKTRAGQESQQGGKMSANVLKDLLALTQAQQGGNQQMTREDIIEKGRRGA
jgi:hypothetical protein